MSHYIILHFYYLPRSWEAIAGFITQHMPSSNRTDKEVLLKVKEVQKHGQYYIISCYGIISNI